MTDAQGRYLFDDVGLGSYEVRAGEEVLCKGDATLVFVDAQTRSCPMPSEFRATVAQFEELAG